MGSIHWTSERDNLVDPSNVMDLSGLLGLRRISVTITAFRAHHAYS